MQKKLIAAAVLAGFAMAGCGSLSEIDKEGRTRAPVFPDVEDTTFKTGSFPNIENLAQVREGATRDQLYALLGRPHFSEGFNVREWDYLFHFDGGRVTCQFKVLFDTDRIARSFHWLPENCAPDAKPVAETRASEPFNLSGDVSFGFGSAVLTAAGVHQIRAVASQIKSDSQVQHVTVVGHTDRIGGPAANDRLSEARAASVRQALIAEGLPAPAITAKGVGERQPIVTCEQTDRSALIACLAPNRRVEIDIQAKR